MTPRPVSGAPHILIGYFGQVLDGTNVREEAPLTETVSREGDGVQREVRVYPCSWGSFCGVDVLVRMPVLRSPEWLYEVTKKAWSFEVLVHAHTPEQGMAGLLALGYRPA